MTDVFTVLATGGGAAGKVDRAEVKRAALVLFDPALGVQIQQLSGHKDPAPHQIVKGDDLDGILKAVDSLNFGIGVYWIINPCAVGRVKPCLKDDIVYRRWLFIDCDPLREADTNSTDDEHDTAQDTAYRVMEYLSERGWPLPIIIDSGNGWHLLYRLDDLPNKEHSKLLVKGVLVHLGSVFNTPQVEIDPKTFNANRLGKLPGTQARKGPVTDDRPHRMVRMVFVPEPTVPVTVEQMKAVGETNPPKHETNGTAGETKPSPGDPFAVRAGTSDEATRLRAYARVGLEREVARVTLCPVGQRNNTLNTAAFSMGTMVGAGWILEQEAVDALFLAATRAGLSEGEARGTIRSGMEAGKAKPRTPPEQKADHKSKAADPQPVPDGPLILRASKVTPRKVEWLWPGRIPLGKMTTFAGRGGLGKTFVLLDIASRVSRGLDWPDTAGVCSETGSVLFISGEDDPDDTLVPRLISMGADLDRVAFLSVIAQDKFTLKALDLLTAAVGQLGSDTRLVVIDPPTSYLAGADDHKNAELRTLLTPLKEWAARARVAVVFNTHVNKATGTKVDAASRIIGSVAWANAVRAAHMFSDDPEDKTRSLFCPVKLNVGRRKKGLAYRIKPETESDDDGPATIEWLGEVDTTADEAINKTPGPPKRRHLEAAAWLAELFRDAVEIPSRELFQRTKQETTVSDDALREAKDQMGIRAEQKANGDGRVCWWWFWTAEARQRWTEQHPDPGKPF